MKIYDIAIVGGGAAGAMAAISASQAKRDIVLIERNDSICRKVLITGKGRCNITNTARVDTFIEMFGKQGQFLRTAFTVFSNEDLMEFLRSKGLELKAERQGRVFPVSDDARSVVSVLEKAIIAGGVEVILNLRVMKIAKSDDLFELITEQGSAIKAKKIILTTGGASYKATGSSGDGLKIAKELGHEVTDLKPGLVPLRTKEAWVKSLQGLTLKNIRLIFITGKKKIVSSVGDLMFTHFGISGPLVLDLSAQLVEYMASLKDVKEIRAGIDLKSGLDSDELDKRLLEDIKKHGTKDLKNMLRELLPVAFIPVMLDVAGLDPFKKASQLTQGDRKSLVALFKMFPIIIVGSLPVEEAMVTNGGVSARMINPRTLESRVIQGLYFAGEIIDGSAASGGYNLQQAFSTGYLAGQEAANA